MSDEQQILVKSNLTQRLWAVAKLAVANGLASIGALGILAELFVRLLPGTFIFVSFKHIFLNTSISFKHIFRFLLFYAQFCVLSVFLVYITERPIHTLCNAAIFELIFGLALSSHVVFKS